MLKINVTASPKFGFFFKIYDNQGCRGYGDDLPSPQTRGDSMGIFNQPEITR